MLMWFYFYSDWRSPRTWVTHTPGVWYRRGREDFSTDQWRTQHAVSEPKLLPSVALAQWYSFGTEESRGQEAGGSQGKHPGWQHLLFGTGKFGSSPYHWQQSWGWKEVKWWCLGVHIIVKHSLKITQNWSVKLLKESGVNEAGPKK